MRAHGCQSYMSRCNIPFVNANDDATLDVGLKPRFSACHIWHNIVSFPFWGYDLIMRKQVTTDFNDDIVCWLWLIIHRMVQVQRISALMTACGIASNNGTQRMHLWGAVWSWDVIMKWKLCGLSILPQLFKRLCNAWKIKELDICCSPSKCVGASVVS